MRPGLELLCLGFFQLLIQAGNPFDLLGQLLSGSFLGIPAFNTLVREKIGISKIPGR